jgi:hypothetical protein
MQPHKKIAVAGATGSVGDRRRDARRGAFLHTRAHCGQNLTASTCTVAPVTDSAMHPFGHRGMTRADASFGGFVTRGSTEGER